MARFELVLETFMAFHGVAFLYVSRYCVACEAVAELVYLTFLLLAWWLSLHRYSSCNTLPVMGGDSTGGVPFQLFMS